MASFERTSKNYIAQQFSIPSYITIEDRYEKKGTKDPRFFGKQFATTVPKKGKTRDTVFDDGHPWLFKDKVYDDSWAYRLRQKEKKKGFMTSDFDKRDEYTEHFRSEQYKERVKHEAGIIRKQIEEQQKLQGDIELPPLKTSRPHTDSELDKLYQSSQYTFDIVHNPNLRSCPKCARDKFFCPHIKPLGSGLRHSPSLTTSSMEYGYAISTRPHEKPEYARIPIIRETFYRHTGLLATSAS